MILRFPDASENPMGVAGFRNLFEVNTSNNLERPVGTSHTTAQVKTW